MTVCVSIVRAMIEEIERRGLPATGLLRAASLDTQLLDDPRARIDVAALDAMTRFAFELTGDPAFGLAMGEHASIASFGLVGHMAAQCRTIGESFDTLLGYARMVADVELPRVIDVGDHVHLVCDPITTEDARCNQMRSEFVTARLFVISKLFVGKEGPDIELWFPYEAPPHAAAYSALFGGRERFEKPYLALVFARALLDVAQHHHDGELLAVLRAQADRWLRARKDDRGVALRVKELLVQEAKAHVEMSEVARRLGMSERSLRRKLAASGVSFHDVLHEARASLATKLLGRADATVDGVAAALGFPSAHAFQRAFKRWSGKHVRDVLARR